MPQRTPCSPELFFRGRPGDPRLGEWVSIIESPGIFEPSQKHAFVLYGCPDDKGVELNKGRKGAAQGPDGIRKQFYKMTAPMDSAWEKKLALGDWGNCGVDKNILTTHSHAEAMASAIAEVGHGVIVLGGGHDFVAPNFSGFVKGQKGKTKCGLINIDPHLDVRPWENKLPHSGTGFRTLLETKQLAPKHFIEFGARSNRNAVEHFQYCKKLGVPVVTFENIRKSGSALSHFSKALKKLAQGVDKVGVSFDMDACSEIEGVSAPTVVGFSAWEFCEFAYLAGKTSKVGYLEIAEVAPTLDPSERTTRLAAEVLYYFLRGRAEI